MGIEENIKNKTDALRSHIEDYKAIWLKTARADNGALFPVDMLSTATTHRAMCLISGFCDMIEKPNFICAAPLVRLLLDSLLRYYSIWLVDQPHDLVLEMVKGEELRKTKDRNGKKMTDSYLVSQLSIEYPWIEKVYRETSGYIHLSSKHYFNTVKEVSDEDRSVLITIGSQDTCISNEYREEAIDAMLEISKTLMRYLYGYAHTKETEAIATKYGNENPRQ